MDNDRRLAAILAADIVGFSALMERDESGALELVKSHRQQVFDPAVDQFNGRIVKLMGDGVLVEFSSVVDAVNCALAVQKKLTGPDQDLLLRMGVNLGDVIIDGSDIYGDGVNIASRLEALSDAGGICISSIVYDSIGNKIDAQFEDSGIHTLKNIERPVQVYKWSSGAVHKAPAQVQAKPDKPSIVVLPFDNLTSDPNQEYFADGMVEAITAALANIRSFFVIARNTAFTYKGKPIDIRNVGEELGVGYALEGSIQRSANRIRITAQLIETVNGAHVWAKKFDGNLDDIFELQDQITEHVAGVLQPSIQLAEIERTRRKRPQDFGVYDFTMQALPHCWLLEKGATDTALTLLGKALDIDPNYPQALSLSAWCHAQRSVYNWTDNIEDSNAKALNLAEKAAEQSNDDPLVLSVLGTVHTILRNHGTARILLERAVSIDANAAWAWSRLAWLESYAGNCEAAIAHFEKSNRLSPLDPLKFNSYAGMASAYEGAQNYEKAVEFFQRALQERPSAVWIHRNYASVLVGAGEMDRARASFAILLENYPDLTCKKIRRAMGFTPEFLDRMLDKLKQLGLPD